MVGNYLIAIVGLYYGVVFTAFFPAVLDSLKGLVRGEPPVTLRTIHVQNRS